MLSNAQAELKRKTTTMHLPNGRWWDAFIVSFQANFFRRHNLARFSVFPCIHNTIGAYQWNRKYEQVSFYIRTNNGHIHVNEQGHTETNTYTGKSVIAANGMHLHSPIFSIFTKSFIFSMQSNPIGEDVKWECEHWLVSLRKTLHAYRQSITFNLFIQREVCKPPCVVQF